MDRHNYLGYETLAKKLLNDKFRSEAVDRIASGRSPDNFFANFLCEAKRMSGYGIGGDAFRDWYAGLFKDGVYLFVHNYDPGIMFTENPNTQLTRGCQDSRCNGDAQPKPKEGEWIHITNSPHPDITKKVLKVAEDLLLISANLIINKCKEFKKENDEIEQAKKEHKDSIVNNWLKE